MSKHKLGQLLGYKNTSICQWESGYCRPCYETLALIAEIFFTTTDYLIGYTDERNRT